MQILKTKRANRTGNMTRARKNAKLDREVRNIEHDVREIQKEERSEQIHNRRGYQTSTNSGKTRGTRPAKKTKMQVPYSKEYTKLDAEKAASAVIDPFNSPPAPVFEPGHFQPKVTNYRKYSSTVQTTSANALEVGGLRLSSIGNNASASLYRIGSTVAATTATSFSLDSMGVSFNAAEQIPSTAQTDVSRCSSSAIRIYFESEPEAAKGEFLIGTINTDNIGSSATYNEIRAFQDMTPIPAYEFLKDEFYIPMTKMSNEANHFSSATAQDINIPCLFWTGCPNVTIGIEIIDVGEMKSVISSPVRSIERRHTKDQKAIYKASVDVMDWLNSGPRFVRKPIDEPENWISIVAKHAKSAANFAVDHKDDVISALKYASIVL